MYPLNNILPQLLNIELAQINFLQAFGFVYLFNLFFEISKSDDKMSKDNKENKEIAEEKVDHKEIYY